MSWVLTVRDGPHHTVESGAILAHQPTTEDDGRSSGHRGPVAATPPHGRQTSLRNGPPFPPRSLVELVLPWKGPLHGRGLKLFPCWTMWTWAAVVASLLRCWVPRSRLPCSARGCRQPQDRDELACLSPGLTCLVPSWALTLGEGSMRTGTVWYSCSADHQAQAQDGLCVPLTLARPVLDPEIQLWPVPVPHSPSPVVPRSPSLSLQLRRPFFIASILF